MGTTMNEKKNASRDHNPAGITFSPNSLLMAFSRLPRRAQHFFLGDVDKGFEWLERAYSRKESDLMSIQHDLSLDSFRADPRYLDLLKRLGLD